MAVIERRLEQTRQSQFLRVRSEIAARVERLCACMSREELDRLLDRMATVQIKYVHRRSVDMFPETAAAERLQRQG